MLNALKFDAAGNLWILRSTTGRTINRADVVNPDGQLIAAVEWPYTVEVINGVVSLDEILGVVGRWDDPRVAIVRLERADR